MGGLGGESSFTVTFSVTLRRLDTFKMKVAAEGAWTLSWEVIPVSDCPGENADFLSSVKHVLCR